MFISYGNIDIVFYIPPFPLSSQQSLKVVGFDDPLIARVPYDLYEARACDSVIRMDGSTRNSCGICRRRIVGLRRSENRS